jgi:hypothetical protein
MRFRGRLSSLDSWTNSKRFLKVLAWIVGRVGFL